MIDLSSFLKEMISLPGLSGYESPVREAIARTWQPLVDELSVSKLGSLHGLRRANVKGKHHSVLIATHMDAIGLMVAGLDDGLLRVMSIGGLDLRILVGQMVTVHGKRELPGILQMIPDRLKDKSKAGNPPSITDLFVDTGLPMNEVSDLVNLGDLVSFATLPQEMSGGALAGHSLDNRASVAALTLCLEEIRKFNLAWDVWAVATTQEEETLVGARTSAYEIKPDIAVVVDVTFAKGPGVTDYHTFAAGKGPTIGVGSNMHPALGTYFKTLADEMDLPYAMEYMPKASGTDAVAIQVSEEGIPCAVLGIPLRYMHTPLEMVVLKDIQRTARLLARFITQLETDTMEKIFGERKA